MTKKKTWSRTASSVFLDPYGSSLHTINRYYEFLELDQNHLSRFRDIEIN